MQIDSAKQLSAALAVALTILSTIVAATLYSFEVKLELQVLVYFIAIFLIFFFTINFFVSRFINNKLNIIYKSILKTKGSSSKSKNLTGDVFKTVNKDVVEWMKFTEQQKQEYELKEEYRREFIGNVSHELKTPIFNIQGYILTLLEGGLEDPNINRKYLQRAEKSVSRMINLVNDLDTITRLEAGQLALIIKKVDIVALAKEVIEYLEDFEKEKNINIVFNKEYNAPIYVKCDKQKIFQVLSNLLINSIKYGKQGGKTEIRFFKIDDNVMVEVADNGVGMDEKHLPRLFERFYRVEESRSRDMGGSGLGLAIVKHIIEAHDQTINVRSTKDVGSTFSFTLEKA